MRRCHTCHEAIPAARLKALPDTQQCVSCSTEEPIQGFMTWEHKTAPAFQVVTPQQHRWLQSRDRKGMRSGLPMSARGTGTPAISPTSIRTRVSGTNVLRQPSARRCQHHDQPQVSASGLCLECALIWYQRRAWAYGH